MSAIKDIYCQEFYNRFANSMSSLFPSFEKQKFISLIYDDQFEVREWKERMKHTTRIFHAFMPAKFSEAVILIEQLISGLRADGFGEDGLAMIFLADYVEIYGIDDFDHAVKALEIVTQFVSCEFAVRPFILKYGDQMIAQMTIWSTHENSKVRRLASEGSRPRLPWAMAIPALKKNPAAILPILENLKNDPSESVRRSVANSLNDIAKDNPDIVIAIASRWKGENKQTDALVKHGLRTLLKQGHPVVLQQYGLESKQITLIDFEILTPVVRIGESVEFTFSIRNDNPAAHLVRLEYGLYYQKAKGHLARKVFKISERLLQKDEQLRIQRKQSFKLITTRKFHTGVHQLSVIINGEEKGIGDFTLIHGQN